MKKVMILMLMMGLVTLSACSSNEENIKSDESDSDMSTEQSTQSTQSSQSVKEVTMVDEPMTDQAAPMEASEESSTENKMSICKNGDQVRTISVVYNEGGAAGCEVIYEKSTGVQSLWNAKNDLSYCETKAREFVKKQEGWGWTCSAL